jgi:formyltetrahydrofolate-dependent phosphoribosylglycinamide formyltransferase
MTDITPDSGRVRVGVLISGRGSNLAALIEATQNGDYPAEIVVVLANASGAGGLEIARQAGIEAVAIDHRPFKGDREAHERAIDAALREAGVELVALAGYMRVFTPWFVQAWRGRMINIHPSLLPHFPGVDTHARALAAGHDRHGCTVHWVTEGVDAGPVIGQADVPVVDGDTVETLAARVLAAEHRLYPRCMAQAARSLRPATQPISSLAVEGRWPSS